MEHDYFLGRSYHCGKSCAWLWQAVMILTIFFFCAVVRRDLLNRLKSGIPVESEIYWNETTTIRYPAFSVLAGLTVLEVIIRLVRMVRNIVMCTVYVLPIQMVSQM